MAPVALGWERDPSQVGTEGLLGMAVGGEPGFKMVVFDFYKERLDDFKQTLQREAGSMSWVIGGRGTGKSEVLAHLFRVSVDESPTNPRLPLYISITDKTAREAYQDARIANGKGRDENLDSGSVTMGLFNYLCSRSLLEALVYLRSMDEGKGRGSQGFSLLRKCLENDDLYNDLTGDEGVLDGTDFSLLNFMKLVRKNPMAREAFRLAIICDDFDKLSVGQVMPFFSDAQNDFQTLSGTHRVVIVSSVTKDFVKAGKTDPRMNYCMSQTESKRKVALGELWVPDISELTSGDIQEFIDHRIRHLHWDGVEWGFNSEKAPHERVQDVIEHELWDSYDTTPMRRNGSLLELNAWLSGRDEVSMRQIITCLDTVLNSGVIIPKAELTPSLLESALKMNAEEEIEEIGKELHRRVKKAGVSQEQLRKEEMWLEDAREKIERGEEDLWEALCTLVLDKIGLGAWKPEERGFGLRRITLNFSDKSGIFHFINLVNDLQEDTALLPKVVSRTPDEVFKKISPRHLQLELEKIQVEMKNEHKDGREEALHVEAQVDSASTAEEGASYGIISKAYKNALDDNDLEFKQLKKLGEDNRIAFGHSMAYYIVRWMIGVGKWESVWRDVRKSFDDERHIFVNILMHWFSLVLWSGERDDDLLLDSLHAVIRGEDPMALHRLSSEQGPDPLDELALRREFRGAMMSMKDYYDFVIPVSDLEGFKVKLEDIKSPKWQNIDVVLTRLKLSPTVYIEVDAFHQNELGRITLEQDMVRLTKWIDNIENKLSRYEIIDVFEELHYPDSRGEQLQREYLQNIHWRVVLDVKVSFECNRTTGWLALCNGRDEHGNRIPWVSIDKTDYNEKKAGFRIDGKIARSHPSGEAGVSFKSVRFFFEDLDGSQDGVETPWEMRIKNLGIGAGVKKRSHNWLSLGPDSAHQEDG